MTQRLNKKRALVTGGSRGIGAAIVKRLASEGADVALTYVSNPDRADEVVKAAMAHGVQAFAIKADAADPAVTMQAVDRVVEKFGGIDILVNNAGVLMMGQIDDLSLEAFDRTYEINIRGVFAATKAAVRHMKPGGRIINIGSCNADRMPFAGGSAYAMSKSALVGLVKGLSRDLGPRGITINNIQPGPVDTDLNPATSDFAKSLLPLMSLGRYSTADEIAGMVAYLASPESGYITGASLTIDGGFTA